MNKANKRRIKEIIEQDLTCYLGHWKAKQEALDIIDSD